MKVIFSEFYDRIDGFFKAFKRALKTLSAISTGFFVVKSTVTYVKHLEYFLEKKQIYQQGSLISKVSK